MPLIVLIIFSYALYRMAVSYNITPWKWITRYVMTFMVTFFAIGFIVALIYGPDLVNDKATFQRVNLTMEKMLPFVILYEFVLFFFFRTRIVKYVHNLDQVDKTDNTPPQPPKKEEKDLSYFR